MRPFKGSRLFKIILLIELILVFSLASAFLIIGLLPRKGTAADPRLTSQGNLLKNFRLLKKISALAGDAVTPLPATDSVPGAVAHPLVSEILKVKRAETLLSEKKYTAMLPIIGTFRDTYGFLTPSQERLHLKYLSAAGDYSRLIGRFDAAVNLVPDTDIQLYLLDSLLRTGHTDRAILLFKELFLKNSLHTIEKAVPFPRLKPLLNRLTFADWQQKLSFLADNNRYSEFLLEKKYVPDSQLIDLFSADFLYRQKQYTRAKNLLLKVVSPQLLNHKKKLLIKIDIRLDHYQDIINRVAELKGEKKVYAELLFDAAAIFSTKAKYQLTRHLFSLYLKAKREMGQDKDDQYYRALWVSAWLYYRSRDIDKTRQMFLEGSRSPIPGYKTANLYWLSRLDKNPPRDLENYPFSYYYTRIADDLSLDPRAARKNFSILIDGRQGPFFLQVTGDMAALLSHRLIDDCLVFVKWAKNDSRLTAPEQNVLKIIESILYSKRQDHFKAFVSFRNNFPHYPEILLPASLSQIYTPRQYQPIIQKYARLHRIDPLLILALIKEETVFDAGAVSPARAIGLMQLLFSTARKMASQEKVRLSKKDLLNPEINVRYGVLYFKTLLDKYQGQVHLALAAYNAGDHRVDRWLRELGAIDTDLFIEMIPFTETRNYVKNIFRNYYYYRYYYGKS